MTDAEEKVLKGLLEGTEYISTTEASRRESELIEAAYNWALSEYKFNGREVYCAFDENNIYKSAGLKGLD